MRSWLTLAVMLVLVAGLGWWYVEHTAEPAATTETVSAASSVTIAAIRIDWAGGEQRTLQKDGDRWHITAPYRARADGFMVERMLTLLAAPAEMTMPATDLARFELEQPRIRVTFGDERIDIGALHPLTGGLYVRRGERVLLVEARFAAVVPSDPTALNDKRLLGRDEVPVAFGFPAFKVTQTEGRWRMTPDGEGLSQDELLHWIENWRLASALRAEPYAGAAPATRIAITLRDGRTVDVGVTERDGEIAFLRADEKMRYYLFPKNARALLAPPTAAAEPATTPK